MGDSHPHECCIRLPHALSIHCACRWFQLVIVLTTDNTILHERLETRGYSAKKLKENIECEIMMVVQEDALESYRSEIVQVLQSNTTEDMDRNMQQLVDWIRQQKKP